MKKRSQLILTCLLQFIFLAPGTPWAGSTNQLTQDSGVYLKTLDDSTGVELRERVLDG